jgi:hypothetical protein
VRIHNNTLAFMPVGGIRVGDGANGPAESTEVYNNIIYAAPRALDVYLAGTVGFKSDRNLGYQAGTEIAYRVDGRLTTLVGWRAASGQDKTSRGGDPLFFGDPRGSDFYTQVASPARDVALPLAIPAPVVGGSVCGAGPDLGFLESCL